MRETFQKEIALLENELIAMSHMVVEALSVSVDALFARDLGRSQEIVVRDQLINERRYEMEMSCLKLIATQQPMASDLRILTTLMFVVSELERIHDYAKGIGKISLLIGDELLIQADGDLKSMTGLVCDMLTKAMIAFARRDMPTARQIPSQDSEIDAITAKYYQSMFSLISQDASAIRQANYLMWIAHNLERTADRVVNICERIVFIETGLLVELDGEKTIVFPVPLKP